MGVFKVMKSMLAATSMSFLLAAMSLQTESRPAGVVYNDTCKMCPSMDRCYHVSGKVWCCDCDPGKYLLRNCSQISRPKETVCGNCPEHTYTSVPNHQEQCNASRSAESCVPLFNTVFKRGNASQDNRCVCKSGYFAKSPEIAGCKPHFKCPVGFGVKLPGTAAADTFCEYCREGTCSNTESATDRCKPCNSSTPSAVPTSTPLPVTESSEQASIASPLSGGNQLGTGIAVGMVIMFFIMVIAILSCLRWRKLKMRKKKKLKESERKRRAAEKSESQKPLLSDQTDSNPPSKKSKPKKSGAEVVVEMKPLMESEDIEHAAPVEVDETDPENVVIRVEPEAKSMAIPDLVIQDPYKEDFRRSGYEVMYEPQGTNAMFLAVVYQLLISEHTPNPTRESVEEKARALLVQSLEYIIANADDFRTRQRPGDPRPWRDYLNQMRTGAEPDPILMLDVLSRLISRPIQVYNTDGYLQRQTTGNFCGADPILIGQVPRGDFSYVTLYRMPPISENRDSQRLEPRERHGRPASSDIAHELAMRGQGASSSNLENPFDGPVQDSQRAEPLGRRPGEDTRSDTAQDAPAMSDRDTAASSCSEDIPIHEPSVEPPQDELNQSQESMQCTTVNEFAHSQQAYKEDFRRAGYEVMYEPPEINAMFSAVVYPLLIGENTPNPTPESVEEKARSLHNECLDYITANADRAGAEPDQIIMLDALSHLISRPIQVYSPDGILRRETPEHFSGADPILIGQVPRGENFYYVTLHRIPSTPDIGQDSQRVEPLGSRPEGYTRSNIAQDGPAASERGSLASSRGGDIPLNEPPVEPSQDEINQSQESMQRATDDEYAHSQQPSNATPSRQEPETSTEQREQQASLPPTGDQPSNPHASVSSDIQDTEQSSATIEQNPSLPESDHQASSHRPTSEPVAQEHAGGEALPTNPKQTSSARPAAKASRTKSRPERNLPPNGDDPSSPRTTSEPLAQAHTGGEARPTNPKQTSSSRPAATASTKSRPGQNLPSNSDNQSSSYQAGHAPSIEPSGTESSSTSYRPNIRPSIEDPSSETQPSSSYQPNSNSSSEGSSRSQTMSAPGSVTSPSEARSGSVSNAGPESRPAAPSATGQPASSRTPPAQHQETNVRVPTRQEPVRSHAENLAVFRNRSDQTELARLNVGEPILFDALESTDYVVAMCNLFVDKIRTQDLKEMLRSLSLLSEIMIEDIENENRYDHKEMRRKFLKEMCFEQGDRLTPRILLNKAFSYRMRKPYDDLCKAFLQHLKTKENL